MKEEDICWECGKKMKDKKVDYSLYGIKVGVFPAKVCDKCGETFFDEITSKRITEIAKKNEVGSGEIFRFDNSKNEVCVKLSKGRSVCFAYFNNVYVVLCSLEVGLGEPPVNTLKFNVIENRGTDLIERCRVTS